NRTIWRCLLVMIRPWLLRRRRRRRASEENRVRAQATSTANAISPRICKAGSRSKLKALKNILPFLWRADEGVKQEVDRNGSLSMIASCGLGAVVWLHPFLQREFATQRELRLESHHHRQTGMSGMSALPDVFVEASGGMGLNHLVFAGQNERRSARFTF